MTATGKTEKRTACWCVGVLAFHGKWNLISKHDLVYDAGTWHVLGTFNTPPPKTNNKCATLVRRRPHVHFIHHRDMIAAGFVASTTTTTFRPPICGSIFSAPEPNFMGPTKSVTEDRHASHCLDVRLNAMNFPPENYDPQMQ